MAFQRLLFISLLLSWNIVQFANHPPPPPHGPNMADKQASSLYVRYAGFEHVFVLRHEERTQYDVLAALIQSRYLTYVDWSSHNPYSVRRHQKAAYQDCVDKYGKKVTRQVAIDIDEYPCRPGVKFHAEISQKLLPPRNTRMSANIRLVRPHVVIDDF